MYIQIRKDLFLLELYVLQLILTAIPLLLHTNVIKHNIIVRFYVHENAFFLAREDKLCVRVIGITTVATDGQKCSVFIFRYENSSHYFSIHGKEYVTK